MEELIKDVEFIINKHNLRDKRRHRDIIHKRMFLFNLLKQYKIPISHICKFFGVHHATVIHAVKQYKNLTILKDELLQKDTELYKRFFRMKKKHYTIDLEVAKFILKDNEDYLKELEKNFAQIMRQIRTLQYKFHKKIDV